MRDFFTAASEFLNTELFKVGDTAISASTLVMLLIILLAAFLISKWLRRLVRRLLEKRNPGAASTLGALIHYAVLIIGFSTALSTAGIDLTGLFAAGAIFAVGLGFAMQSIVQNFVAGVILISERTIKPGDVLEVEGNVVKVSDMGIRASIVQSRDGEEIIVPNSILSQNSVKNYTFRDSYYRIRVPVGVVYSSDMSQVRQILERVAAEVSKRWGPSPKPPLIVMTGFGDHSVNWEVGVWMRDPWEARQASSDLHESIWNAFQKDDIVIAFPQLDLHLDPPVAESLRRLAEGAA